MKPNSGPSQAKGPQVTHHSPTMYTIGGIKVDFPAKAYPSQLAMMNKVIQGLKHRQNCLLESPTGSGKSLALLCASLAWQRHEAVRVDKYNAEIDLRQMQALEAQQKVIKEQLALKAKAATQPVPQNRQTVEPPRFQSQQIPKSTSDTIPMDTSLLTSDDDSISFDAGPTDMEMLTSDDEDLKDFKDFNIPDKHPFKSRPTDGGFIKPESLSPAKGILTIEKPKKGDEFVEYVPAPAEKKLTVPKIYFGTRTHKQIAQITRELRKTFYKSARSVILSSREHTCIHPVVQFQGNKNDACKELLDKATFGGSGCEYHAQAKKLGNFDSLSSYIQPGYDLEEFVGVGRRLKACPYYASRHLMANADIIFCPYNYLIDPNIRRTMTIELEGQIVIFDEAHNMEDASREATSFAVLQDDIQSTLQDYEKVGKKGSFEPYAHQQLAQFLSRFMGWMLSYSGKLKSIGFDSWGTTRTGTEALGELQAVGFTDDYLKANFNYFSAIKQHREEMLSERSMSLDNQPTIVQQSVNVTEDIFRLFDSLSGKDGFRDDFRVAFLKNIVKRRRDRTTTETTSSKEELSVNIWCLNPAVAFKAVHTVVHSIVLTSGTLSPMQTFESELGTLFSIKLEANHVIDRNQVFAGVVSVGPNNYTLSGAYSSVGTMAYQDELGELVLQVCQKMPHGILCFFPSYRLLELVATRWTSTGMWGKILVHKNILVEPRTGAQDFQEAITEFYDSIENPLRQRTGALFLAVCRGKVSEGLDFADNNARAVICVGIPFPAFKDLQVEMKREYNQKYSSARGLLTGSQWYEIQAFRALNQALGRCIRHRNDWGAILMVDDRYIQTPRYVQSLSKWVRSSIQTFSSWEPMIAQFCLFRDEMLTRPSLETSFGDYRISNSSFEDSPTGGSSRTLSNVWGENSESGSLSVSQGASNSYNSFSSTGNNFPSTPSRNPNISKVPVKENKSSPTIKKYFVSQPQSKRAKSDTANF